MVPYTNLLTLQHYIELEAKIVSATHGSCGSTVVCSNFFGIYSVAVVSRGKHPCADSTRLLMSHLEQCFSLPLMSGHGVSSHQICIHPSSLHRYEEQQVALMILHCPESSGWLCENTLFASVLNCSVCMSKRLVKYLLDLTESPL